ncbi:MAG TPA: hypothetical protein VEU08_19510 [Vicinamibacterales bacterium]|nr:hypothetical protein [Vicinamibacterales bacterium]
METSGIADAVNRLKGAFLEIPGTKLKPAEAARLCGLETPVCGVILDALKDAGFLRRGPDGSFVRAEGESR